MVISLNPTRIKRRTQDVNEKDVIEDYEEAQVMTEDRLKEVVGAKCLKVANSHLSPHYIGHQYKAKLTNYKISCDE